MSDLSLEDQIHAVKEIIDRAYRFVLFGGAGVSTESGIPDFRGADGLYTEKGLIPPEKILSRSFFKFHPKEFYSFYRDKLIYTEARPNMTHIKLAEFEKSGKCAGVITQNIDGLHQLAGSEKVFELHGSIYRNYCVKCGHEYGLDTVLNAGEEAGEGKFAGVPVCACGGIIKPDVVLYQEDLDKGMLNAAVKLMQEADLLIIGGTSLNVFPAASLLQYFRGDKAVIINKEPTQFDKIADVLIHDSLGKIFEKL